MLNKRLEKYAGISDCVYEKCAEEFNRIKLNQLDREHEIRILRPFLLTWGL